MEALALRLERDVLAARGGDRAAFTRLVDKSRNVVCSITLAIVRDVAASEDVAQDVFLAAWDSLDKLRNPSSFLPWLRQLTRNHAHEFMRSRKRYRHRHAPWEVGDAAAVIDAAADASHRLVQEEERQALADAIEHLPDEAREIVTLYYREGNSTRQVAELLGLSEDAVKKRLERARSALRLAVVERFAEALKKTAPSAAFSAAVAVAIATGAPGTASAASLGIAGAGGTAKLLAGLGAGLGGALAGMFSGLIAVRAGHKKELRLARDEQEKIDLGAFQRKATWLAGGGGTLYLLATLIAGFHLSILGAAILSVATYIGMATGMYLLYMRELPRITARRRAAELAEDPNAAKRHRRETIYRWLGFSFGTLSAAAGLATGLYFLLRHGVH